MRRRGFVGCLRSERGATHSRRLLVRAAMTRALPKVQPPICLSLLIIRSPFETSIRAWVMNATTGGKRGDQSGVSEPLVYETLPAE